MQFSDSKTTLGTLIKYYKYILMFYTFIQFNLVQSKHSVIHQAIDPKTTSKHSHPWLRTECIVPPSLRNISDFGGR